MAPAQVILDEKYAVTSRYRVELYAVQVPASKKFPAGVKAKFILIDVDGAFPRLLVDNHEPFGFHMHTELPEDRTVRVELAVRDHNEALDLFLREVERIIASDEK